MNMHCMTARTYGRKEDELADTLDAVALNTMLAAGREERRLAVDAGDLCRDGVPFISVVVDGMWSKRSYKNKYDAKSGTATIIGYRTNKILWTATREKACAVCDYAAKKKKAAAREHKCAKNWTRGSTAMEADIILEGFKSSMEMHKLRFTKMIGIFFGIF